MKPRRAPERKGGPTTSQFIGFGKPPKGMGEFAGFEEGASEDQLFPALTHRVGVRGVTISNGAESERESQRLVLSFELIEKLSTVDDQRGKTRISTLGA